MRLTLQPAVAKREISLWKYAGQALAISMKPCPASPNSACSLRRSVPETKSLTTIESPKCAIRVTACACLCAVRASARLKPSSACPPGSAKGSGGSAASIVGSATSPASRFAASAPCAAFSAAESGCESSARVSVALMIFASPTVAGSSKCVRAGASVRGGACKMRSGASRGTRSITSPNVSTVNTATQARDVNGSGLNQWLERRSDSVATGGITELFANRVQHLQIAIGCLAAAHLLLKRGLRREQFAAVAVRRGVRRRLIVERILAHECGDRLRIFRRRFFCRRGGGGARSLLLGGAGQVAHVYRLGVECG